MDNKFTSVPPAETLLENRLFGWTSRTHPLSWSNQNDGDASLWDLIKWQHDHSELCASEENRSEAVLWSNTEQWSPQVTTRSTRRRASWRLTKGQIQIVLISIVLFPNVCWINNFNKMIIILCLDLVWITLPYTGPVGIWGWW